MTNLKNKKAFSLIELSIVILIIGIIIAGLTQSSRLISQFRLSSARSQTQSAPVSSITGLTHWFETTSEESFDEADTEDHDVVAGAQGISTWYDINKTDGTKRNATQSTATNQPFYYASCINDLPCARFDGTDNYMTFDGSVLSGGDYTIFVVEQRRAGAANYFLGSTATPTANTSLVFGYEDGTTLTFGQGDTTNYHSITVDAYDSPVARLHTYTNGIVALSAADPSVFHYLNASSTASTLGDEGTPALSTLTAYTSASIGSALGTQVYFDGDIGEIIIFNRYLKTEERVAVENYLLKKWSIAKAD